MVATHAASVPASRALDGLALRAQRGEPGAVDALLETLIDRLRPIVGYLVLTQARGALCESDIEDVLHDVVLQIWRHDLAIFDASKSGFMTFVNRRMHWHITDESRKIRRRRGEVLDDDALEAVIDDGRDPESLLRAHQAELAMLDMVRTVDDTRADDKAKDVLVRHDLQGATLAEVAKELHIHVSSACRARQRGLRFLARHLEAIA
jgi:RNA polymerase sigma factor (sigma-70 family)